MRYPITQVRCPTTEEGLERLAMRVKLEEEMEEMRLDEEDIRESWDEADRQREVDEELRRK